MSQFLKVFMIIMLYCTANYAAEPSSFNSKQSLSSRSKRFPFKKRHHCSSSQKIAPPGPPGPQGPQGPQGPAGSQGVSGTNIFAFANFLVSSNAPVDVPIQGLIPYSPGVLTNIAQDSLPPSASSEAIILIPGNYVIDFTMTISNPSNIPTTYTVGIVKRNLFLGPTTYQTLQTYAIRIGDITTNSEGGAFSLIGQDMLTLNIGDRVAMINLSNSTLQLFGTPPAAGISAIDTPAAFTIRLLDGS